MGTWNGFTDFDKFLSTNGETDGHQDTESSLYESVEPSLNVLLVVIQQSMTVMNFVHVDEGVLLLCLVFPHLWILGAPSSQGPGRL